MRRIRALVYSAFVSLVVFLYLALPTLRELYGPVVDLPVYALVALTAGRLAWALLADSGRPRREAAAPDEELDRVDADVEEELATLKDDR